MAILSLQNICFSYGTSPVLKDVSYDFEKGRMYCIIGKSGVGKTTLLSLLSGLASPDGGHIFYDGQDIAKIDKYRFRSNYIGVIFQSFNLITKFTAVENVVLSMDIAGKKQAKKKERAKELLYSVGLSEDEADRRVLKLSGGQQQRVAIARALAAKPAILLADEPTGNLDSRTSQDVLGLMKVAGQKFSQTMVMITHNEEIAQMADRIVRIEDGRIVSGK